MGKRKFVPARLQSELTEYASLIRALRASNSLDVTSHLAKASLNRDSKSNTNLTESDTDNGYSEEGKLHHESTDTEDEYYTDTLTNANPPTSSAVPSRDISPRSSSPVEGSSCSRPRKRKTQSLSSPPQRRRDAWTRWPLLIDDMHVPEWSFEDEIGYLAERILKQHRSLTSLPPHEREKEDEIHGNSDSEDVDDPSYLPHLTQATTNYLSSILALLVAHTPNRPDSLQNRVEPMGWRGLLDMLSSCGDPNIADPKILSSVQMRMESLHSTYETTEKSDSDSLVAHRIQRSISAKQKLRDELSSPLDSLLGFPDMPEGWIPPRPTRLSVRKVRKTQAKTPVYIEDEEC